MKPLKLREDSGIDLSIKNLAFILSVAIAATIGWFQLENRIGDLETANKLMEQDLLEASTQKPIDQEQFMLLEHIAAQVEKVQKRIENMMHNKVNIERNQKDIEKALADLEKLKDKVRANGNH